MPLQLRGVLVGHVHWPPEQIIGLVQLMLDAWKLHKLGSFAQVTTVVLFAQTGPAVPVQTGSALHVQLAVPDGPTQLWLVGQATGVPYEKQPLMPSVQVASPPLMHDVCPIAQLFEQVREHLALGALPEQTCGAAQGAVDATNAHESESTTHVTRVWPSWQAALVPVQMDAAQVQDVPLADMVQVWCVPQVLVVVQAEHPLACTWQI